MKSLKYSFQILFIALFLGLGINVETHAGENTNQISQLQQDTVNSNVVRYEVFGMDCPGCQSALEKQVKKIEGVADAKASFVEKEVVVELKQGAEVSDKEIEERIKKANFTPGKKIKATKDEG